MQLAERGDGDGVLHGSSTPQESAAANAPSSYGSRTGSAEANACT